MEKIISNDNEVMVPVISIGMPVYNGEKTLRAALDSILGQTFSNFELIISDNASSDGTEEICREYIVSDSRIRYIRQAQNIGAPKNFRFVLDAARCDYFMWATADDVKSPNFLECNYSFLENNAEYVASTSPVRFEGADFNAISMGDASLTGDRPDRIIDFFNTWHANGRFCSLMKTNVLKTSPYVHADFFGSDWAAMLDVIAFGKTNRHSQGYVVLGRDGFSNSGNIFDYYRKSWIHWILPFFELNKAVLSLCSDFPLRCRFIVLRRLAKLNLQAIRASAYIKINKLRGR
ncbi:MAG: glycosyltransferase family 2 protein [Pseudomonadota bacterium]